MKKLGKLIYCALGAALVLTGCGKKDNKTKANFAVKSGESYYYINDCEGALYFEHFYYEFRWDFMYNDFMSGFYGMERREREYDENHNVVTDKYYYYNYEIYDYSLGEVESYDYDENGNLICREYVDYTFEGEVTGKGKTVYLGYDEFGNYAEERIYYYSSEDNYQREYLDTVTQFIYEYDEAGNVTKQTTIDHFGDTTIELYTYDDLGRQLTYMYGWTNNKYEGYSFSYKEINTYFEGDDSEKTRVYQEFMFDDGAWVETYHREAEMDEEGYIYKESEIEDGVVTYYWEAEKVSDTKIVVKDYDLAAYDPKTKEAEYFVYFKIEIEYRNHEELLNDGEVVSYKETEYFNDHQVAAIYTYKCSYDKYGNYIGCEDNWYVGQEDSSNDVYLVASYYASYEYVEIK